VEVGHPDGLTRPGGRAAASTDTGTLAASALAALSAAVVALAAAGVLPRWPGLPHLVALPPLDLFADTRWLLTRATGYPSLAAGLTLSLAVRVLVLAYLLGGPTRERLGFAARFYALAFVPALLVAQLQAVAHPASLRGAGRTAGGPGGWTSAAGRRLRSLAGRLGRVGGRGAA
jgi:hypothetical protein